MAFSTIQGSGSAPDSYIGTSGADDIAFNTTTLDEALDATRAFFLGAQAGNDTVIFSPNNDQNINVLNSNIRLGAGNDAFVVTSNTNFASTFSNTFVEGGGGVDVIAFDGILAGSTLQGGEGNDIIDVGVPGSATSRASVASSVVNGNQDNDVININSDVFNSLIGGGQGNDSITTAQRLTSSTVRGGGDNDTLTVANSQNSLIEGNEGADSIIVTTANSSTIGGGEGADTIAVITANNSLIEGGGDDDNITAGAGTNSTYLGGQGNDTISGASSFLADGGDDNDSLNGSGANDTLAGGAGNDTIDGNNGADILTGGEGDDRFIYSNTAEIGLGETIDGGTGFNTIAALANTNFTTLFPTTLEVARIQGVELNNVASTTATFNGSQLTGQEINFNRSTADTNNAVVVDINVAGVTPVDFSAFTFNARDGVALVVGDQFDIDGDTTNNTILGSNFASDISGRGGNDLLTGGDGDDTIDGGTGDDTINGGAGNDVLQGGAGLDIMNGGAGDNTIIDAGAGADIIFHTFTGSTTIANVSDIDQVTLIANVAGASTLSGAFVNSQVDASNSAAGVTLTGDTGNDSLTGGTGNDTISGGDGTDTLTGGAGADTFNSGAGADVLIGGAGRDTFIYDNLGATFRGADRDTIVDFNQGANGDVLQLTALNVFVGLTAGQTFVFSDVAGAVDVSTTCLVDTSANLATVQFVNGVVLAYDTTTNRWLYDADGNWSSGSISFATSTIALTQAGLRTENIVVV